MKTNIENTIKDLEYLYLTVGKEDYSGENISLAEHMYSAAEIAQREGFDEEFILAAFLHDLGNLIAKSGTYQSMAGFGILGHEYIGADYLRRKGFSERIALLVENHVNAKRYLTAKSPDYYRQLTIAGKHSLAFQGGTMSNMEAQSFESHPYFEDFLELRRIDEDSKEEDINKLNIDYYIALTEKHLRNRANTNFDLPQNITNKIDELLQLHYSETNIAPIAAFDLDNTLLDGDIGEALYAQLKCDELITNYQYSDYLADIKNSLEEKAFIDMIKAMSGLKVEDIENAINLIFNKRGQFIEFKENDNIYAVLTPSVNPKCINLINYLKSLEFRLCIISASSDIAVKAIAERLFDIDKEFAVGIQNIIINNILSSELKFPIPTGSGKKTVYEKHFKTPPLITAGDSTNDLALLQLTHPKGLVFYRGYSSRTYQYLRTQIPNEIEIFDFQKEI